MKRKLKEDNWVQRIIRIKSDYIKVCTYFEFLANRDNINKDLFINNIFSYSLKYLSEQGFNYDIDVYKPMRIPKGFPLDSNTAESFRISHEYHAKIYKDRFDKRLYIAEYVELLLYIYVFNNLKESEIVSLGDIDWGIRKLK